MDYFCCFQHPISFFFLYRLPTFNGANGWYTELCLQPDDGSYREEFHFLSKGLRNVASVIDKNKQFVREVQHVVDVQGFPSKLRHAAQSIERIRFGLYSLDQLVLHQLPVIKVTRSGSFCFGFTCVKAGLKITTDRGTPLFHFNLAIESHWWAFGLVHVVTDGSLETSFRGLTDWHVKLEGEIHIPIINADIGGSLMVSTTHGINGCLHVRVFSLQLFDACFQFLSQKPRHRGLN